MNPFEEGLLRYLSAKDLAKLRQVKIGIAGAGGLGSNCAAALVRSGVRRLKIADFDVVDYSNLNRQFYFLRQAGEPKINMLQENLVAINPAVELELLPEKVTAANVAGLFGDCDVVVEAFDRAEYKKLIVESYLASGKLLVAASGLAGWGDSDRIKVHKVKENFYLVGDLVSGIGPDCPPLAPCVAIAAAKQADIVLQYVLGTMKGGASHEA
ncbi:MAG: sulfur carrier protein ThiS adenylyltransferase ThiF [Negativicutes bacterium]|nr:sulfur carrier protein ThiS adenylyltransferase ThiF [Negativicutes bacterium]